MKVLVVGGGAREHVLAWKLSQSVKVKNLYAAPGNPGIAELAQCIPIKTEQIQKMADWVKAEKIDLTIVGPEAPLALGLSDAIRKNGQLVFGPSQAASKLESSKLFAKEIMKKYKIPTGFCETFTDVKQAKSYAAHHPLPMVIKADGLAQGKGVTVCQTREQAHQALDQAMTEKVFSSAGDTVLVEEYLEGEEATVLALVDGKDFKVLPSAQDHKRALDGDQGPNTGGMGAYSPAPVVTPAVAKIVEQKIIKPLVEGMAKEGIPYQGLLYVGLMITPQGPKVIEFNVRFGDPEAQAVLPLLKNDLAGLMLDTVEGRLAEVTLETAFEACVCVVLASHGYPGLYEVGKEIFGLETVKNIPQTAVFHAGTVAKDGKILTAGGRVLTVSAWGESHREALNQAYQAVKGISFEGMHFRKDIAHRLNLQR